jgi:hypothetical protein
LYAAFGDSGNAAEHVYSCSYLLGAAGTGVPAGAVDAAGAEDAAGATVVIGGGDWNSFLAFFQSCVTPHVQGSPTNSHANNTSTTGVFFT